MRTLNWESPAVESARWASRRAWISAGRPTRVGLGPRGPLPRALAARLPRGVPRRARRGGRRGHRAGGVPRRRPRASTASTGGARSARGCTGSPSTAPSTGRARRRLTWKSPRISNSSPSTSTSVLSTSSTSSTVGSARRIAVSSGRVSRNSSVKMPWSHSVSGSAGATGCEDDAAAVWIRSRQLGEVGRLGEDALREREGQHGHGDREVEEELDRERRRDGRVARVRHRGLGQEQPHDVAAAGRHDAVEAVARHVRPPRCTGSGCAPRGRRRAGC